MTDHEHRWEEMGMHPVFTRPRIARGRGLLAITMASLLLASPSAQAAAAPTAGAPGMATQPFTIVGDHGRAFDAPDAPARSWGGEARSRTLEHGPGAPHQAGATPSADERILSLGEWALILLIAVVGGLRFQAQLRSRPPDAESA